MTPQERKLIDELFDRLASLESAPREGEAVRAINDGLKRAPNALYPLVQTALVQDEALKRADARIRELEDELGVQPGEPVRQPGFLDSMRDALLGSRDTHGSVPTVRPAASQASASPWGNMGQQQGGYAPAAQAPVQAPMSGGGSFLGTAAAAAAGVVGGALLMNSLRGLFGGHDAAHGAFDPGIGGATPWNAPGSNSDLARDAGIESIGRGGDAAYDNSQQGLFDTANVDSDSDDGDFDVGGDFGGDGGNDAA